MAAHGLLRTIPIWNFLVTGISESGGHPYTAGPISTGSTERQVYAGMHLVSCAAVNYTAILQTSTSAAFVGSTTRFTFAAQACSGSQYLAPLPALPAASTELFWTAFVTAAATTDTRLGIIWIAYE